MQHLLSLITSSLLKTDSLTNNVPSVFFFDAFSDSLVAH